MNNLTEVGFRKKVKSFFRKIPGIKKNVDEYLADNFSNLLKSYEISRKNDLQDTINDVETKENAVEKLFKWRDKTKPRVNNFEVRIKRLETKYGVK